MLKNVSFIRYRANQHMYLLMVNDYVTRALPVFRGWGEEWEEGLEFGPPVASLTR